MEGTIKADATAALRLRTSGEVAGEKTANEPGEPVSERHAAVMANDEFRKCLNLIEKVCLTGPEPISIELIGKLLSICKSRSERRAPLEGP